MVVIKDFLSGMNKKQKVPCFGTVCLKRFKVIDNFEKMRVSYSEGLILVVLIGLLV